MIKNATNVQNLKLNIFLRDGTQYLNRDAVKPQDGNDRFIVFWESKDNITLIPLDLVAKIEMFFEDDEESSE